jgi:transcriptional regulator with XRE-family HTH domain
MLAAKTGRPETAERATLGERIRAAREAKGWSQVALAARLGLTITTISRWEHGWSTPRRRALRALSRALRALSRALGRTPDLFSAAPPPRGRQYHVEAEAERIARALAEITEALQDAR